MICVKKIQLFALTLGMAICSDVGAVEPLRTNGASFRIPFAVDQANVGSSGTAILFASKDGAPMEPVQRVSTSERSFHFLAPGDGKFQFAVRMTDAAGKLIGEDGPLVPELEVIVDSKAPTVQVELVEVSPGVAVLNWSLPDQDVDPASLRIEYLDSSTGVWKPVAEVAPGISQATIKSNPGQSVAVRASVKDRAGNTGNGSGQIILSAQGSRIEQPAQQTFLPFGAQPGQTGLNIPSEDSTTILGTSPFSLSDEEPEAAVNASPVRGATTAFPQTVSKPISMNSIREAHSGGLSIPASASKTEWNQPVDSGYADQQQTSYGGTGLAKQHLNNRLFDLAYEIDSVGPSGVSSVVLYVTEDNGKSWFKYGVDKDLKSPFKVDTRGEGTFGFAVRVRNGVGFADPPPQPGEVPSVVVSVDQTPPVLRMATPELLTRGQGVVQLRWDIQEAHPADEAVRLEYATSPDGPWSPVFDWQQNPGGFELPVDSSLPPALHFRLLARDAAGNVSTTQNAQPVLIDRQRPKARVLSVKPQSAVRGF